MRDCFAAFVRVTALLLALVSPAAGYEVEETRAFPSLSGGQGGPLLRILATTDIAIMEPVIAAWQARNPDLALEYALASSQDIYRAIAEEGAPFDLVISSAMDLQMKLANDGLAAPLPEVLLQNRPEWARWRGDLVAVAQEPVVLLMSDQALPEGAEPPRTRRDLITMLRDRAEDFRGRVGTYDPATSGVGYLFAAQDARLSDTFWRLAEVMGRLDARLYCCSGDMIADVAAGRLWMAYNVLGSYAALRGHDGVRVVELEDFTLTLLRTALIPANAPNPAGARGFLGFLLSPQGQALSADGAGLPVVDARAFDRSPHLRAIRLDPGLLAALDPMARQRFLEEWRAAMEQP